MRTTLVWIRMGFDYISKHFLETTYVRNVKLVSIAAKGLDFSNLLLNLISEISRRAN